LHSYVVVELVRFGLDNGLPPIASLESELELALFLFVALLDYWIWSREVEMEMEMETMWWADTNDGDAEMK
jgi:hypothetical protein